MPINYTSRISEESKMRSPDRILVLKPIEGKKPLDSGMRVDPRLFKDSADTNRLHGIMDLETSLWSMKYEKGSVPPALSGKFTGFKELLNAAKNYYNQRNIEIVEVKD
jgi:hypothetical protein